MSLEPLRNLTPFALSNLRHLKLILNEASCHSSRNSLVQFANSNITRDHKFIPKEVNGTNQPCRLGLSDYDTVLLGDERGLKLLAEWERAVEYLSSRISPDVLDFSVVCDIFDEDIDIAERVVSSLALLPMLKNCHVRLSHVPNREMNRMARDAALRACGKFYPRDQAPISRLPASKTQSSLYSPLLALPLELRLHILEHTDLVTPWKEVKWHRTVPAFAASLTKCNPIPVAPLRCAVHHGCQFIDCWHTCPEPSIGCFCHRKHSAFSSHCKCWEPPRSFFLVCRTLYKEAQVVLFSQNRFVVHDSDPFRPLKAAFDRPPDRFTASIFLEEAVPQDCLGHLRSLEFVFPAYEHRVWPTEGRPDLLHWMKIITTVKEKLNLPALNIRLVMAGLGSGSGRNETESRRQLSNTDGQAILAAYDRIVGPLVQLGGKDGLAGFYADFEWPWSRTEWASRKDREWVKNEKRALNERAEMLVLGKDRFGHQYTSGSNAWGAADSLWTRKHIRSSYRYSR